MRNGKSYQPTVTGWPTELLRKAYKGRRSRRDDRGCQESREQYSTKTIICQRRLTISSVRPVKSARYVPQINEAFKKLIRMGTKSIETKRMVADSL